MLPASHLMKSTVPIALALVAVTLVFACGEEVPKAPAPGPRVLAISASPRTEPKAEGQYWVDAVNMVVTSGAQGAFHSATWSSLEPRPQGYALDDLTGSFDGLGKQRNLELLLGIQVINTTAKEVPADLAAVPFDSPSMIQRFHQLIDAVKPKTNSHLGYLSVGNEVDVYLSSHPAEFGAYRKFYEDAVDYAHTVLPGVKVGVTVTFDASTGPFSAQLTDLNRKSDIVVMTYYPLGERFKVRPPGSARQDIPKMVKWARGRPLVVQEVGYPTAPELASSEQSQSDFVDAVFSAWKEAGGAIPFLNFFLLHDIPKSMCEEFGRYYGLPDDTNFKAYLCTLGLRQRDGTPKLGWKAFQKGGAELKASLKATPTQN
jgi:hypothetical protein